MALVLAVGGSAYASVGHGRDPARLAFVAPSSGETVSGTVTVTVTVAGAGLGDVDLYRDHRIVAVLEASEDRTSASGELDTTDLPDGRVTLRAVAPGGRTATGHVIVQNEGADFAPEGGTLVFADEFSGDAFDHTEWCTRYPWSGGPDPQVDIPGCTFPDPWTGGTFGTVDTLSGNGEEQRYRDIDANGDPLHTVQDGYLSLHAAYTDPDAEQYKFESGMLRSTTEFVPTRGNDLYITGRMRMPSVQGSWPAFWLITGFGPGAQSPGWPPEIDIMEAALNNDGDNADMLHFGAIYGTGEDGSPAQGATDWYGVGDNFDVEWGNYHSPDGSSMRDRWVEVGIRWSVDEVCWFVDGEQQGCKEYKWIANDGTLANPATINLNLAVGGSWAGRAGIETEKFPTQFDVDHVRVYMY